LGTLKKKKKKKIPRERRLKTTFYLLSGVLYEPYLLMDALIGAIFSWFPLESERAFLPAGGEKEGDAVPEAADD
jgi:hypothetical protein